MQNNLLGWEIHTSKRFIVKGNIGLKLIIHDLNEQMEYVLEYSELHRFRNVWQNLNFANKDKFICMTIVHRKGTPLNKKVA